MNRIILFLLFLSFGCESSKYPGFTEYSPNLYYQRVQLGDGIVYHPDSCFLDYSVSFYPLDSSNKKIKNTIKFAQLPPSLLTDSIIDKPQKGDFIKLIVSDNEHYMGDLCKSKDFNENQFYEIELRIDEVYNLYIQEEDPNVIEYKSIQRFLRFDRDQDLYKYNNGIWLKTIENQFPLGGIVSGEIVLDYIGLSLDGDTLDKPDYPMQFNTAARYQVIKGIEIALSNMHYGDSVLVIIPSYLAFGELGSKNGNVPPYEALKYYLKVYDSLDYYRTQFN